MRRSPPPKALIAGFAFLALALFVGGIFQFVAERRRLIERQRQVLDAIAELKTNLLANWVAEREADAVVLARGLAVTMQELWGQERDPVKSHALVDHAGFFCRTYSYDSAEILDLTGRFVLGFPERRTPPVAVGVDPAELAPPPGRRARISFEQVSAADWRFRISTELRATEREPASGWLILTMDPKHQVEELLSVWPGESATAETLLLRRSGDLVTFLGGLRGGSSQGASRVPVEEAKLVEGALGHLGSVEGVDSRQQTVLASARLIPGSPWTLVAKVDRHEVVAGFESVAREVALAVALMFSLSLALALGIYYRQHRETTAKLELANRRFLALFDHAQEGVVLFGRNGRILGLNATAREMFRIGDRTVVGLPLEQVVAHEDLHSRPVRWRELEARGSLTSERQLRRTDGELIVVQVQSLSLPDGRYISILHDLTERRATEQRERRAKRIAKLGAWHWDVGTDAVHWDDETFLLFGYDPARDRAARETWLGRVHQEDRERVEHTLARALAGDAAYDCEYRILLPDGGVRWFRSVGDLQRAESGAPLRIEGVIQDLTEQHHARAALDAARWQLAESQKTEAIGRLAGGIAHDFNNVVGIILGYGELAAAELAREHPAQAHLAEIGRAAGRAGELTKRLLAFARRQPVAQRPVDFALMLEESGKLLAPILGENIELQISAPAELGAVRADPSQLTHLVLNLALNARDAMPRGGRLALTARAVEIDQETAARRPPLAAGAAIEFTVEDTGVGMDAATLRSCFEPFFTTKGPGEGTGLGLSSVKRALESCDGALDVDSKPGRGTRFRLWFPAIANSTPENDPTAATAAVGRGEIILVVDDLAQMREVARSALASAGFRVTTANAAESALARLEDPAEAFDLLLTDIIMPGLDGRMLARRALAMRPNLPVLFMTGYADLPPSEAALEPQPECMIEKPFTGAELAQKVRTALDRRPPAGGSRV